MFRVTAILACLILAPLPAGAADRWFTTSDGVRLHYLEQGPAGAPAVVFVPGWTMPAWIFAEQVASFSRIWRTVALDPRSQGDSAIASSGHDPWRRGKDIAELIDRLGRRPVVLVGWSLGVLDSLAYLHENGDSRIAGLVLVDNSVGENPPPAASPAPARRAPKLAREASVRRFVAGMFRHRQSAAYIEALTEASLRTPPEVAAALLSYPVPRTYWREAVYSTAKPVLYIVTPRLAGQAANLEANHKGAESVVMQGVGHALFVDDPARFDATVQSFIHRRVWP